MTQIFYQFLLFFGDLQQVVYVLLLEHQMKYQKIELMLLQVSGTICYKKRAYKEND